jgi:AmmeMemoRadiSam system protein B
MIIREAAWAGRFYAAEPGQCLAELKQCISSARLRAETSDRDLKSDAVIGGVVPHAGWPYSGAVAARVFNAILTGRRPDVVIVFGAVHVPRLSRPAIFPSGAWRTPLGLATVDDLLVQRLHAETDLAELDSHSHDREHSIEVEVPFIQHLLPKATIVPIMIPVDQRAAELGRIVGLACKRYGVAAVFLASTDLTHYGPGFSFAPEGVGEAGLHWAKTVNDRRMIDLMLAMRDGDVVAEAVANRNACGGGAIAAGIAASKSYGAKSAALLEHTTSHEVAQEILPEPARDSVGYAAMVFT